jgi:hypothetical protein
LRTSQATWSSSKACPKKREDCLSPEWRSHEVEFRSAGQAFEEGGRSATHNHHPARS